MTEDGAHSFLTAIAERQLKVLRVPEGFEPFRLDGLARLSKDESDGQITSWKWDFGDGSTSREQNPIHQYKAGREYTTILEVEGPAGKSRFANVWGVSVK